VNRGCNGSFGTIRDMQARVVRRCALVLAAAAIALAGLGTTLAAPVGAHPWHDHDHRLLDADDAVLTTPIASRTVTLDPVEGCRTLLVTGEGDCATVRTAHGDLVVTVEPGPRVDDVLVSRPWTVKVYRPSATVAEGWDLALATRPEMGEPGPLYAAVTARAADVTDDGRDELVIGYRDEGTGSMLDLDVVMTDTAGVPYVAAHDELYKGSVVFRDGHLVTFTPVYKRHDGNCCPTWVARDVLRYHDGRLEVDRVAKIRTQRIDVPPSQLG